MSDKEPEPDEETRRRDFDWLVEGFVSTFRKGKLSQKQAIVLNIAAVIVRYGAVGFEIKNGDEDDAPVKPVDVERYVRILGELPRTIVCAIGAATDIVLCSDFACHVESLSVDEAAKHFNVTEEPAGDADDEEPDDPTTVH